MTQFKEGDQVRLKSGGPVLTVEMTREDGIIGVVWFRGDECHRDAFHKDALILAIPATSHAPLAGLTVLMERDHRFGLGR